MESPLDTYIDRHCTLRCEALDWLERQTNIRTNYPRMLTGKVQGDLLYMLTRMIAPSNVLEIGTFTGYSAICMALGLEADGHIDTLEINDELEDLITEGFEMAGVDGRITLHIGDALDWLRDCPEDRMYEMAFIDANKRDYPEYYELVLKHIRPGGFILVDDVLWDGKVYAEHVPGDKQTAGIVHFNEMVAGDSRVESMILPVRHGLSIIRKRT